MRPSVEDSMSRTHVLVVSRDPNHVLYAGDQEGQQTEKDHCSERYMP